MIRPAAAAFLLSLLLASLVRAEQGQLDASQTLFTVLTAINAAGYDAELDSPSNNPLRQTIRQQIAALNPPSVAALKQFLFAIARLTQTPS